MSRNSNARVAGAAFLVYIAAGVASMARSGGAAAAAGAARSLPGIVLSYLMCFSALTLAVTLYGITRDEDNELALMGLSCRLVEGILGAVSITTSLASSVNVSATFFAVGSTIFSYLLLRGRMIPILLAWLGVAASLLLVIALPLQLAGVLSGATTQLVWLPMAAFEIPLAFWLLVKGVAPR